MTVTIALRIKNVHDRADRIVFENVKHVYGYLSATSITIVTEKGKHKTFNTKDVIDLDIVE